MENNLRSHLRKAGSLGLASLGIKGQLIKVALNQVLPADKQVPDTSTAEDLRVAFDSLTPAQQRLLTKQLNKEPEIKQLNKEEIKDSIQQVISSVALAIIDKHGGFKNPWIAAGSAIVAGLLGYLGWL